MQGSKLIQILESLSKTELNRVGDFVHSPFFNKNENISNLFDYLYTTYPKFNDQEIHREIVFRKVFINESYDEQKLRYAMSDLTKLIEEYLIYWELNEHPVYKNHLLLNAYQKKNLTKYSQSILDQSTTLLEKNPYRDSSFYDSQFMIEKDTYEYISIKRNVAVKENLESVINNLDAYYIINKLKYSSEIINHTNVMAGSYEPLLLEEIASYLEENEHRDNPAIAIYYQVLMTLLHPEQEHYYFRLKKLLEENINKFPQDEVNDMYIFARNYCAKKINSGENQYLKEIFDLYKTLLHNGIILQNGFLSQWDYKNIVMVALKLEEVEWVESFIKEYKGLIKPEERENVYRMNMALLEFHRNNFDKTLELIRDIDFTDVYYHLNCKMLLLKSYYELEEIDPLYSLLDTVYNYLRRNKQISDYHKEIHLNFLKQVKKLVKIRYKGKEHIIRFKKELLTINRINNLEWLEKKADELIDKK